MGRLLFQERRAGRRPQQPASRTAVHPAGAGGGPHQSAHPLHRGPVRPVRLPPVPQHLVTRGQVICTGTSPPVPLFSLSAMPHGDRAFGGVRSLLFPTLRSLFIFFVSLNQTCLSTCSDIFLKPFSYHYSAHHSPIPVLVAGNCLHHP